MFYLNIFKNTIYCCDGKYEVLLQSSMSHDPSEIKHLFIIINIFSIFDE